MKKIVCLALALLMVLGLAACGGGGGGRKASSYEAAIDAYFNYHTGKATKKSIENMAPAEYWENGEESVDEIWDEYEGRFEDYMEELEDYYGKNVKHSYKIKGKEKVSKSELEEFAEYLEEAYDIDPDSVTQGYDVEMEVTIKGSEEKDVNEVTVSVVKIGDAWYVTDIF